MLLLLGILSASMMCTADSCMQQLSSQPLANPALTQWMSPRSESEVGVGYHFTRDNARPIAAEGTGYKGCQGEAGTYLKLKDATVWGHAGYSNYSRQKVKYNESLNPQMLYPYLSADTVGGDINDETYRFGGGYASTHQRLAWGLNAGYEAQMSYRRIDPRPQNIAGTLTLKAGAAYRLMNYYLGLGAEYLHYSHSLEIDFKSEAGKEKIYQLTGLGSHYKRFAGASDNAYYSSNQWSVSADIYPAGGLGLSGSLSYSGGRINKSLSDLNNLPFAAIELSTINFSSAWISHHWGVGVEAYYHHRTGQENLFGLPQSNNFPLISTLELYHDKRLATALTGIWQRGSSLSPTYISAQFTAGYSQDKEIYTDGPRSKIVSECSLKAGVLMSHSFGKLWRVTANDECKVSLPISSSLTLMPRDMADKAEQRFIETETLRFNLLSSRRFQWNIGVKIARRINDALFATLAVNFNQIKYFNHPTPGYGGSVTLAIHF